MKGYSFIDDEEKMVDFLLLSKEQFLESYSYLNPEDWDETCRDMMDMLWQKYRIWRTK